MENKIIFERSNVGILKIISKDDMLAFSVGSTKFTITDYHEQDCCESVYADFNGIQKEMIMQLEGKNIEGFTIKGVDGEGLLICFDEDNPLMKLFIGCHNSQNGYYSSQLEIIIDESSGPHEERTKIDMTQYTEDEIY